MSPNSNKQLIMLVSEDNIKVFKISENVKYDEIVYFCEPDVDATIFCVTGLRQVTVLKCT